MGKSFFIACFCFMIYGINVSLSQTYPIVDTDQGKYYNNTSEISAPATSQAFFGQDTQYLKDK